jgi:hypothetical protein
MKIRYPILGLKLRLKKIFEVDGARLFRPPTRIEGGKYVTSTAIVKIQP